MYGKIFEDIFGSTVAEFGGDTIYVLMSMVVLSDAGGYIRMTPEALARIIRKGTGSVEQAIGHLEAIDPRSSTPDYQGRRIIKLSEVTEGQENRGWWVVNKVKYTRYASQIDRVDQNREAQQRFRDNQKDKGQTVSNRKQPSAPNRHEDRDVDVNESKPNGQNNPFDLFWSVYPRKVKKKESQEIWKRKKLDLKSQQLISDIENRLQKDDFWKKGFIPHPTTYLRGERWNDDIQVTTKDPEMKSRSQVMRVGAQMNVKPKVGETMEAYEARVRTMRHE